MFVRNLSVQSHLLAGHFRRPITAEYGEGDVAKFGKNTIFNEHPVSVESLVSK